MSPREEELAFEEAGQLASKALERITSESTSAVPKKALQEAISAIERAAHDLKWNVYPTDTSQVFRRIVSFTVDLRQVLYEAVGGEGQSEFKDDTLLEDAHKVLGTLQRHLKLTTMYDNGESHRALRLATEQDQELAILEERGNKAKGELLELLRNARKSLRRLLT
jgi:hypothetical protein